MSAIGVHLVNRAKDTPLWTSALRVGIARVLGQLFTRVCTSRAARPVDAAQVRWGSAAGDVRSGDLVVHFSPDRETGVGRQVTQDALAHSQTGQTIQGHQDGKISEVFVLGHESIRGYQGLTDDQRAQLFAKAAFHECMHNKLHPLNIHTEGGGGLSLTPISWDYGLTGRNIDLMAPALRLDIRQNTGFM